MKLRIVIRQIEDDLYIGSCPDLPGCHIEAESEEQAQVLLKAAINAYIISHNQRHEKIPAKPEI